MIDPGLHAWGNAATLLIAVGAACYLSLIPYMTRDK